MCDKVILKIQKKMQQKIIVLVLFFLLFIPFFIFLEVDQIPFNENDIDIDLQSNRKFGVNITYIYYGNKSIPIPEYVEFNSTFPEQLNVNQTNVWMLAKITNHNFCDIFITEINYFEENPSNIVPNLFNRTYNLRSHVSATIYFKFENLYNFTGHSPGFRFKIMDNRGFSHELIYMLDISEESNNR